MLMMPFLLSLTKLEEVNLDQTSCEKLFSSSYVKKVSRWKTALNMPRIGREKEEGPDSHP